MIAGDDARTKLNNIYDKINENTPKKTWARLNCIQKQERIKEFVERTSTNTTHCTKHESKLLKMLNDGKLKNTFVDYDITAGTVISINIPKKPKSKKIKTTPVSNSDSDE
jgi:hypothetical protein